MGFEIVYKYHPRLEEGVGYDTETTEEKTVKVGKPFDDTPLEKCAAAIMAQLARRDVWVVDVSVNELVKKEISFKEAKDGKGIVLKNKKFSLNSTAQMISEVEIIETPPTALLQHHGNGVVHPHEQLHPHEIIQRQQGAPAASQNADALYANPNQSIVARSQINPRDISQKNVMYHVYFEPYFHAAEAAGLKLKFSGDKKYPVHKVIPSATGKLDQQKIAVTDDTGKLMILDEKFFTSAGQGLVGDAELGFSNSVERRGGPKLAFEDQMHHDHPAEIGAYKQVDPNVMANIPVADGGLPTDLMAVPNLRPGRKV